MYLINTRTYELEQCINPESYAILSHTWQGSQEVVYEEFVGDGDKGRTKKGFRKIKYLCAQALEDQLEYAWIDTVCIDKRSSAELSEAINSMFAWYQGAKVCYVFLADVDEPSDIAKSRWITRGWTLQELLAPENVRFYNRDWVCIGTKASLVAELVRCTRIDQIALTHPEQIHTHSAATRMSWAAFRSTTREEDMAYCLLGLFGVNMPLLYGERGKAFVRLQEQILKQDQDTTILAFNRQEAIAGEASLLAKNPDVFGKSLKVLRNFYQVACEVTGRGLQMRLRVLKSSKNDTKADCFLVLDCRHEFVPDHLIAIRVRPCNEVDKFAPKEFLVATGKVRRVPARELLQVPYENVLLLYKPNLLKETLAMIDNRTITSLRAKVLQAHGFEVVYARPANGLNSWNAEQMVSEVVSTNRILVQKFGFLHAVHEEAFILMVAIDSTFSHPEHEKVWFNVEAKPKAMDYMAWLQQHGMYSILKQPYKGSDWHTSTAAKREKRTEVYDGIE